MTLPAQPISLLSCVTSCPVSVQKSFGVEAASVLQATIRLLSSWQMVAGTLKDDQHCYLCGQNGHRQFECPNQPEEIYQLPNAVQEKVQAQYERDIARMAGPGEAPRKDTAPLPSPSGTMHPVSRSPQDVCRMGHRARIVYFCLLYGSVMHATGTPCFVGAVPRLSPHIFCRLLLLFGGTSHAGGDLRAAILLLHADHRHCKLSFNDTVQPRWTKSTSPSWQSWAAGPPSRAAPQTGEALGWAAAGRGPGLETTCLTTASSMWATCRLQSRTPCSRA